MAKNPNITIKPVFSHGQGGFVTDTPGTIIIKDPKGNVVETLHTTGGPVENGYKIKSHVIASGQVNSGGYTFEKDGQSYNIPKGGKRLGFYTGQPDPVQVSNKGAFGGGAFGGGSGGAGNAQSQFPISGGGFVGSGPGATPLPLFVDPSALNQPFRPTDILGFSGQTADFNRKQYAQSFKDSQDSAMQLIGTELKGLQSFSQGAQTLQENLATQGNTFNRGEIGVSNQFNQGEFGSANTFNQSELDRIRTIGAPFIKPQIEAGVQRASTYASGKLLSTAEDRAFELTARNASADNSFVSGYGGDSAAADKASTLLSAQQRLGLSMQGESLLGNWLQMADKELVQRPMQYTPLIQQPLQSTVASTISGQPRVSASQLAVDQASKLGDLTTITPSAATGMEAQQNLAGQQFDFQQRAAVYSGLLNFANQTLSQMNQYASNTANIGNNLTALNQTGNQSGNQTTGGGIGQTTGGGIGSPTSSSPGGSNTPLIGPTAPALPNANQAVISPNTQNTQSPSIFQAPKSTKIAGGGLTSDSLYQYY